MSASTNTQDNHTGGFGTMNDMFTRMWSDFAAQMAAQGLSPEQTGPDRAKQMRERFFASWSEACDKYMRSEEFNKMMRESMHAAIELRKQLNEQMGTAQHAMQGASRQDVDRLMHSIEGLERRVNETFGQLSQHFESLSHRLDGLEQRARTGGRGKKAARKPASKTTKQHVAGRAAAKKKSAKRSR